MSAPSAGDGGPRSLHRMALNVALRSITSIVDVGEMPFDTAKPLLKAIENPEQLHQLEVNCPVLSEDPAKMQNIWVRLMERKFPRWEDQGYDIPDDMHWLDIYYFIKAQVAKSDAEAEAALAQKLAGFDKDKKSNKTHIVQANSRFLPLLPGNRRRGIGSSSRIKPPAGMSALQKARFEAAKISKAATLANPKAKLPVVQGKLRTAPAAMVNEYRVAANPGVKINAPKRPKPTPELIERESRLLAIKKQSAAKKSVALGMKSPLATWRHPQSAR